MIYVKCNICGLKVKGYTKGNGRHANNTIFPIYHMRNGQPCHGFYEESFEWKDDNAKTI